MKLGSNKNIKSPRVVGILTKDEDENLIWTYMKACLKCGVIKEFSEYHAKRGKPQPQCKACRSKYMAQHYKTLDLEKERLKRKAWYEKNKLAVSEKGRAERQANPEKYKLGRKLKKYNLTKEQYETMLTNQNNACELCLVPFTGTPHVDHCHDSFIVRGLLCGNCNTGYGLLGEDVATFERCIVRAKKYKNQGIKNP